jgi:hypothetical protein
MSIKVWGVWFAWHPVKTVGGRRVWLRRVDRAWNLELDHWAYDGYSGFDGGWSYRMPLHTGVGGCQSA